RRCGNIPCLVSALHTTWATTTMMYSPILSMFFDGNNFLRAHCVTALFRNLGFPSWLVFIYYAKLPDFAGKCNTVFPLIDGPIRLFFRPLPGGQPIRAVRLFLKHSNSTRLSISQISKTSQKIRSAL